MIDLKPPRVLKHPELKTERDGLRAARRCINGPRDPNQTKGRSRGVEHGAVVSGGRCQRCLDVAHPKKKLEPS
jgi:hypothetical protein